MRQAVTQGIAEINRPYVVNLLVGARHGQRDHWWKGARFIVSTLCPASIDRTRRSTGRWPSPAS